MAGTFQVTHTESLLAQHIIFRAGHEEFGVPIEQVREIIKAGLITPIPNAPSFVAGIMNVRGEIVTTIDIRKRFSLPVDPQSPKHVVVTKKEDGLFGIIVDEVTEVLRIQHSEVKPPPPLISSINKKFLKGVISKDGRLIILLDLVKVLSKNELSSDNESTETAMPKKNGKAKTGKK